MTMPRAGASFAALSSSTSACSSSPSSRRSMPSPVFAETGMNCTSPPYSSGSTLSATSSCFTRSGLASGLSILLIATTSGTFGRLGVRDRFLGLRHDAVVGSHDQHHHVGDLGAARAHRRERLVARRVEERDHALRGLDVIGADVLRDAARLAARHARAANRVEQRRLAVVDVAHHRHHRRPRQQFGRGFAMRFGQQRIRIVELRGLRLVAHFLDDDHRGFLVEHLVDRHHLAELHQRLDDLGGLDRHLVREFGDGDRLRHRHVADDRARRTAGRIAAFVVAMAPAHLRTAPARRGAGPARVAAQLERAPACGFFLEHLARRLLGRAFALLARLGGRPMQRAFGLRLGVGRRSLRVCRRLCFGGLCGRGAPQLRRRPLLPLPRLRVPSWSCARSRAACFSFSSSVCRFASACPLRDSSSRAAISCGGQQ